MPSGPGTYGNKVGRPPKKYKKGKKVVGTAAPKGRGYFSYPTEKGVPLKDYRDKRKKKDKRKKEAPEAKSQSSTLPFFEGSGFGDFDKQQPSDPSTMRGRGFAPFDKKKKKAKKLYNMGGKVRGAGKATQGVRKCKMVTMKGA